MRVSLRNTTVEEFWAAVTGGSITVTLPVSSWTLTNHLKHFSKVRGNSLRRLYSGICQFLLLIQGLHRQQTTEQDSKWLTEGTEEMTQRLFGWLSRKILPQTWVVIVIAHMSESLPAPDSKSEQRPTAVVEEIVKVKKTPKKTKHGLKNIPLPTMHLSHRVASLEAICQIIHSFLWSHTRLYIGVFT